MNREIKFRGKAKYEHQTSAVVVDQGDWVYGYYYFNKQLMSAIIITELEAECGGIGSGLVRFEIEVEEKTVGQYTGLNDSDAKEIFEDDIQISSIPPEEGTSHVASVVKWRNTPYTAYFDFGFAPACHYSKIIGNKHDDPVLLEEINEKNL